MAYERIERPEGLLYHYTKRENVEPILKDRKIKRFLDSETWFCTSLENILRLMELTVMQEGKIYFDVYGLPRQYPAFVPEDYVVLEISPRKQAGEWVIWNQEIPDGMPEELRKLAWEFSHLKIGFRGDLEFQGRPDIHEVSELLQRQDQAQQLQMQ